MSVKLSSVVDDPDVSEVFIDSPTVLAWVTDGVLHLELYALRRNLTSPDAPATARAHLRARIALTLPAAEIVQQSVLHHLMQTRA